MFLKLHLQRERTAPAASRRTGRQTGHRQQGIAALRELRWDPDEGSRSQTPDLIFAAKEAQIGREIQMRDFPTDVAEQLRALKAMKAPELRGLWLATFGRPHPAWVQRDFLLGALAYHFQERAFGGLG